jgi:ABC-type transporter Mla subunit MlaD
MPFLFADPAELRAIAERLTRHAEVIRAVRDRVGVAAEQAGWRGTAAGAFAAVLTPALGAITHSTARIDDASDALHRLAAAVEGFLDDLRRTARDGRELLDDGARLLADAIGDPADVPGDVAAAAHDAGHLVVDAADVAGDMLGGVTDLLGL